MSIRYLVHKYTCTSRDLKPTLPFYFKGAELYVTDTKEQYVWNGLKWVEDPNSYVGKSDIGIVDFTTAVSVYGTEANPVITNILIDPIDAVEGSVAEIIWRGSVKPNIKGVPSGDILNIGGDITELGNYSIFILHTDGKYKVNIQRKSVYVGNGDSLPDPGQPPITNQPPPQLVIDSAEVVSTNIAPPQLTIDSAETI